MKVGITFDLRSWYLDRGYSMEDTAEFDKQDTVDAIDTALRKMGFETELSVTVSSLSKLLVPEKNGILFLILPKVFMVTEGNQWFLQSSTSIKYLMSSADR